MSTELPNVDPLLHRGADLEIFRARELALDKSDPDARFMFRWDVESITDPEFISAYWTDLRLPPQKLTPHHPDAIQRRDAIHEAIGVAHRISRRQSMDPRAREDALGLQALPSSLALIRFHRQLLEVELGIDPSSGRGQEPFGRALARFANGELIREFKRPQVPSVAATAPATGGLASQPLREGSPNSAYFLMIPELLYCASRHPGVPTEEQDFWRLAWRDSLAALVLFLQAHWHHQPTPKSYGPERFAPRRARGPAPRDAVLDAFRAIDAEEVLLHHWCELTRLAFDFYALDGSEERLAAYARGVVRGA